MVFLVPKNEILIHIKINLKYHPVKMSDFENTNEIYFFTFLSGGAALMAEQSNACNAKNCRLHWSL